MSTVDVIPTLDALEYQADSLRPRLFAVYGTYTNESTGTFLGWGMDFGPGRGAIFYRPDTREFWRSSSAERLLRTHSTVSEAALTWLD